MFPIWIFPIEKPIAGLGKIFTSLFLAAIGIVVTLVDTIVLVATGGNTIADVPGLILF